MVGCMTRLGTTDSTIPLDHDRSGPENSWEPPPGGRPVARFSAAVWNG
jgi:hypothetical protein